MATSSVLIPSFRRPAALIRCLEGLAGQSRRPDEVIVVWQGDDTPTRDAAESRRSALGTVLRVLHSERRGVVPAENLALDAAGGDVILLIDDDAVPPPDWVARHLAHYDDSAVGAVGGPADNHNDDGTPFPRRDNRPTGRITWYGKAIGNMYDQPIEWRSRPPEEIDHLVGYNMSLRRAAFDRFEESLRSYWSFFELDACLQVKARGYRVLIDFGNVVDHHPTNTAYIPGRQGDLAIKCLNPAYNAAYILARWSPARLRPWRLLYLLGVGTVSAPGLLGMLAAWKRYGDLGRELGLLRGCLRAKLEGWRGGSIARRAAVARRSDSADAPGTVESATAP